MITQLSHTKIFYTNAFVCISFDFVGMFENDNCLMLTKSIFAFVL
jgi:hypothetical protein